MMKTEIKAFTLTELVVVMLISAVVAGLSYGSYRMWGSLGWAVAIVGFGAWYERRGLGALPVLYALGLLAFTVIVSRFPSERPDRPERSRFGAVGDAFRGSTALRPFLVGLLVVGVASSAAWSFVPLRISARGGGPFLIAVAASRGISRFTACDSRKHQAQWGSLISRILEELDAQVLLIPHVQDTFMPNDDRLLATEIMRSLGFHPRLHLAGADHTAAEFKGLISMCDLVVAERMHAAIAGLSSAVCTLAIGYSIKAGGIMSRLLGERSAAEVVIPFADFLDPGLAWGRLCAAWRERESISATLREALVEVRAEAALNFDLIAQLIGQPARTAIESRN